MALKISIVIGQKKINVFYCLFFLVGGQSGERIIWRRLGIVCRPSVKPISANKNRLVNSLHLRMGAKYTQQRVMRNFKVKKALAYLCL